VVAQPVDNQLAEVILHFPKESAEIHDLVTVVFGLSAEHFRA